LDKWFKRTGKRDEIFLATKFGFVKGSKTYEVDSSGEYCKKACAESLRILDIDSIDLCKYSTLSQLMEVLLSICAGESKFHDYMESDFPVRVTDYMYSSDYMHHANPKTPIEETMRAMVELKA
jgi:aryl-alcohol dehydrogenase-like predicted oxidoreductase